MANRGVVGARVGARRLNHWIPLPLQVPEQEVQPPGAGALPGARADAQPLPTQPQSESIRHRRWSWSNRRMVLSTLSNARGGVAAGRDVAGGAGAARCCRRSDGSRILSPAAATVAEAGSRPEGGVRVTGRQRKRGPSRGQSWWIEANAGRVGARRRNHSTPPPLLVPEQEVQPPRAGAGSPPGAPEPPAAPCYDWTICS